MSVSWRVTSSALALSIVLACLVLLLSCAPKGLLTDEYSPDSYQIMPSLPEQMASQNPTFIIYGDSRPGWRVQEKFIRSENWKTWKMLLFPFYEMYWLGNGVVGGINYARHTPDFGAQGRHLVREAVYAATEREQIDLIFHGGDMVQDGRWPSQWATFLRESESDLSLNSGIPLLPVVGNHERANDPKYGLPNYRAVFGDLQCYALDFPDVAILVIDSNWILDQYESIENSKQEAMFEQWFVSAEGSTQPSWLERELEKRDQSFKIVVMHHPLISFGTHHTDWLREKWGNALTSKRQQLARLFQEQGVQLVLCSHEHMYEHSILNVTTESSTSDIHVVVTGGGGVPLRPGTSPQLIEQYLTNYCDQKLGVSLVLQRSVYHYCVVKTTGDSLSVQVMEIPEDSFQPPVLIDDIEIPNLRSAGAR